MEIVELKFKGIKKIIPSIYPDERGAFLEMFQEKKYEEILDVKFVQDNLSISKYGVIRGMHFQSTPGQGKLVSVIKGRILDVFVDVKKLSETFGQYEAIELDDQKRAQLYIPVGYAHGFCVLSEEAIVQYKVTNYFDPKTEKGFLYNDPSLNIRWPISNPILSIKDAAAPLFKEVFDV
jgi:dTDP-4-dehydrorhamnose 3,5-epimerase